MTNQIIFNIDKKLKERVMKKAKSQGVPLSSVLNSTMRAYADDRLDFGLVEKFNEKTRREIEEALEDIHKGKKLSPTFKSIDEMKKYLYN